MSNAAADRVPRGTSVLQRDLDERELAAAPVLPTLDALVIDDLADDEDAAFVAALMSEGRRRHGRVQRGAE